MSLHSVRQLSPSHHLILTYSDLRAGDAPEKEYCFKSVTTGAASIQEECEAVSSSTVPGTTLTPEQTILEANQVIEKANEDMKRETEYKNSADDASTTLADIQQLLEPTTSTSTSSGRSDLDQIARIKRDDGLEASKTCTEFELTYNTFLNTLLVLSDDNIAQITRLTIILRLTVTSFPCSEQEKKEVKDKTQANAENAASSEPTDI